MKKPTHIGVLLGEVSASDTPSSKSRTKKRKKTRRKAFFDAHRVVISKSLWPINKFEKLRL